MCYLNKYTQHRQQIKNQTMRFALHFQLPSIIDRQPTEYNKRRRFTLN